MLKVSGACREILNALHPRIDPFLSPYETVALAFVWSSLLMRDLCGVTSQRAAFDFSTYSFMFFSSPLNSQIVTYLLNFAM